MRLEILKNAGEVPRETWENLFPGNAVEGYDYYRALDESGLDGFAIRYAAVFRDGMPCFIAPCFITGFSPDTSLQGPLKRLFSAVRRVFPRFLKMKVLFFGSPLTETGSFGVSPECDRDEVLGFLEREMKGYCRGEGIGIICWYNLPERERPLIDSLARRGYGVMESFPIALVDIPGRSLEEYLGSLGKNTRKDMKRKLRNAYASGELRIEERESLAGLEDQAYRLYLNNFERAGVAFEKLTAKYFREVAERMPGETKFFIVWLGSKMVAFNLCFVKGDTCIDKYLGFDYDVAHDYSLYFITWCHNIDWCIRHGIRYYQPGTGDYEPKLRLGGTLVPLYVCARHLNPLLNLLLRRILKVMEPARTDPVLKKLRYEEKRHTEDNTADPSH